MSLIPPYRERWHLFQDLADEDDTGLTSRLRKLLLSAPIPNAKRRSVGARLRMWDGGSFDEVCWNGGKIQGRGAERGASCSDERRQVVLPTGGGKSLLFMALALLRGSWATIVAIPTR